MDGKTNRVGKGGDGLYKKRGFWYFRVVDWNGKRRALSTRTKNYAEARTRRSDYLNDLQLGADPLRNGKLLFSEAAELWLQRRLIEASKNTQHAYQVRVANINKLLGAMPIRMITADTLRRYQIERRKTMAPSSINDETIIIAGVLAENKLWARIKPDFRKLREPKTIGRVISGEERDRLDLRTPTRRDAAPILLVLRVFNEHGLRHNELKTLQLRDIDPKLRSIQIRHAKTPAGARLIPLTPDAWDAIQQLLDRAHRLGACKPEHYLFPGNDLVSVNGRKHKKRIPNPAIPQYTFGDAWRTLRRRAGVDATLRLHDFRHTVATDMGEAGTPSAVAMKLMGWTSTEMRKRYEHIQDAALRREVDRLTEHRRSVRPAAPAPSRTAAVIPFGKPMLLKTKNI